MPSAKAEGFVVIYILKKYFSCHFTLSLKSARKLENQVNKRLKPRELT